MKYRPTRNIEASLIDYLKKKLEEDNWKEINIERTFSRVYKQRLPVILVRVSMTVYNRIEIGSNSLTRRPIIYVDIFGSDEANKLDLKDWVIDVLRNGFDYYEYTLEKDQNGYKVINKIKTGYIYVNTITETEINLGVDRSDLDEHDRFRMLITLNCSLNKIDR